MAETHVTTTSSASASGTASASLTPTLNDIIIVCVHASYATSGVAGTLGCSDSLSNVYHSMGSSTSAASGKVQKTELFWAFAATAAATTITVTASGSPDDIGFNADTFRGVDTLNPILDPLTFYTNYTGTATNLSIAQTKSDPRVTTVSFYNTNVRTSPGPGAGPSGFSGTDFGASVGSLGAGLQTVGAYNFESATGTNTYNWGQTATHYNVASFTLRPRMVLVASAFNGATTGTSASATFSAALEVNDYLIITVHLDGHTSGTNTFVSIVGDTHNSWSPLSGGASASTAGGHAQRTEIWAAKNTFAGTPTVTVTVGAAKDDWSFVVQAFRGVDLNTPVQVATAYSTNYTSTNANNATTITPTSVPALVVACETYDNQGNPGVAVSGFGNTTSTSAGAGAVDSNSSMQSLEVNALTAVSLAFTSAGNNWWALGALVLNGPIVSPVMTGTITTSLTKASLSAVAKETFTGTAATHLTKASQALVSAARFTGTITTHLTKASLSAVAKETFTGTAATHLTPAAMSLSGTATNGPTGTITMSLTKAALSLTGRETFTGSITTTLSKVNQVLMAPADIGGTITTVLRPTSQTVHGTEQFIGSIVTALDSHGFSIVATTYELFVGHIVTNLRPINMAATAAEIFTGHAVTRLGGANGSVVANVVEALEIIEGPIVTTLPPFRPLVLGAMLGTPGQGKWFSWRYTDA